MESAAKVASWGLARSVAMGLRESSTGQRAQVGKGPAKGECEVRPPGLQRATGPMGVCSASQVNGANRTHEPGARRTPYERESLPTITRRGHRPFTGRP